MTLPPDYEERVYAGVLGKIIGVYLGRPFEGWTHEKIHERFGEIKGYVHEQLNKPLIVTDDDISGTFTFLRALPDYGCKLDLTPIEIGQTWLNYIVENRSTLAWGGLGNMTEHTAFLRLKRGVDAPRSGSIELNSKTIAEQIGAQIFIDGWGMVAPGDPELAASLAKRAASVSHDGEAIYGAQMIAVMEALAFVQQDIHQLLDTALSCISSSSIIYRMVQDIREWREQENDWRITRKKLDARYGYDKYPGNCHIVPNHGLIILALLYGNDSFRRSLEIVNTCGWDTDCNSGNLGCLLGIKNGLSGIDSCPDWRAPVSDRLYMSSADGGRAISDALTEAYHIVNIGRTLAENTPTYPKNGARYHFELPGSVQGFLLHTDSLSKAELENVKGHSQHGQRSLAIRCSNLKPNATVRAGVAVFIPPEAKDMKGYELLASPKLYPGQIVQVGFSADYENENAVRCSLYLDKYDRDDEVTHVLGPHVLAEPGQEHTLKWRVEETGGSPVSEIGMELSSKQVAEASIYIDYLTWDGPPDVILTRPDCGGQMWQKAWVDGVDHFYSRTGEPFRIAQNYGEGLLIQGTREWSDYKVQSEISPHLVTSFGIAARVQGMRRYYALLLCNDRKARLIKRCHERIVLGEYEFPWERETRYHFSMQVIGNRIQAGIDHCLLFDLEDPESPLDGGAIAFVCEEGCISSQSMTVHPASL